jgi:hypothetical protein
MTMMALILVAQLQHPWCWQPADGSDRYCGFDSYLSCQNSNHGRDGMCITNPDRQRRTAGAMIDER